MKSTFLAEIAEAPEALARLAKYYRSEPGAEQLASFAAAIRSRGRVRFIGMGTSEFTAESILPTLAEAGIDGSTRDAGEELYYTGFCEGATVFTSQSGESIEPCRVAARLPEYLAIVNRLDSPLGRCAKVALPLLAGAETAISTKTYANNLALLFLLAELLRGGRAGLTLALDRLDRLCHPIAAPAAMISETAKMLAAGPAIQFISRGGAMAAAKQAALTFMEGTRLTASALTGGAFRHGPFELAGADHAAVFFIAGGAPATPLLARVAAEAASHGSRIAVITDAALELPPEVKVLPIPNFGEALFPLAAAETQARLLHAVAACRGVEAGIFRYGAKITAKE